MLARRFIRPAAVAFLASTAVPASALADWVRYNPGGNYCADARDVGDVVSQHLAFGSSPLQSTDGTSYSPVLFYSSCYETSDGNAEVLYQFGPSPIYSTGGRLENLSVTPSGNVWGAASPESGGSLWITQHGSFWGVPWYNWSRKNPPPGGASSIAAVDDNHLYATSLNQSCSGADRCVYYSANAGASWSPVAKGTFASMQAGAVEVAYDSTAGVSWLRTANGHVLRFTSHYNGWMSWAGYDDVGEQGLPVDPAGVPVGALRLAVHGGNAFIITKGSRRVYMLPAGKQVWTELGNLQAATDIAVNPISGAPYVVVDDGWWTTPGNSDPVDNIWFFPNPVPPP